MPLKVSDGIGAWIKDFQKSDAPQFKGKSKEARRDQAVAAYLSAKRGPQNEDMTHMTIRNGADGMSSSDKASHKKEYKKKFGVAVKHSGNNVTYSGKKANVTKAARDHFPDHKDDGMPNDIHKWHDGRDIHVKKEGYMPNYADKMKKKMMTPSDKDKLMKIRQMLDKEKKPVKKEAMTPAQKAAHDKAVADFKKRGGKITKLPPGKAAGYHGKDDPGSGIKGMLAKGTGTKYNIRNRGKHLDKDMSESMLGHSDAAKLNGGKSKDSNFNSPESHIDYHHRRTDGHKKSGGDQDRHRYQVAKKLGYKVESYNHMNEDFMFKVGVEGLPDMIIGGSSPGDIKARLRKIVKQPSMITSVSRMTSAEVKKRYRDMAQGKEDTNEAVKPTKAMHVFNNAKAARAKAKEIGGRYVKGTGKSAGKHAAILEKHVYRFSTKTKQGNIHHPSKDETGAKKAIEKRTGEKVQSMTYRGPVSSMPKRRVREMVDPMDLRGRPKKRDPYDGKTKYGMKHPLHPLNIQKRKEKEKRKKEIK